MEHFLRKKGYSAMISECYNGVEIHQTAKYRVGMMENSEKSWFFLLWGRVGGEIGADLGTWKVLAYGTEKTRAEAIARAVRWARACYATGRVRRAAEVRGLVVVA
jgi:hypothetical protein